MSSERPIALDLSHHLSDIARARVSSPLKVFQRYWSKPGVISLAGGQCAFTIHAFIRTFPLNTGLPNPVYFPFETITGEALLPDAFLPSSSTSSLSWLWSLFAKSDAKTTIPISIPKYPAKPSDVNLAAALQYQPAAGLPALQTIVHEFSSKVYQPAYQNFATLVNIGNTDGLVSFSALRFQSPSLDSQVVQGSNDVLQSW
jgi:aromatic amino acid aminotransferase I